MARKSGSVAGVPALAIVEIDGLPYVDAAWLALRLYRDQSRLERWQQEARRVARRTDPDGIALCTAYRWQALAMSYRIVRWQRCLALTQTALATYQCQGPPNVIALRPAKVIAGFGRAAQRLIEKAVQRAPDRPR